MVLLPIMTTYIPSSHHALNNNDIKSSLWAGLIVSGALSLDFLFEKSTSQEKMSVSILMKNSLFVLVLVPNCAICGLISISTKLYSIVVAYQLLLICQYVLGCAVGRDVTLRSGKYVIYTIFPFLNASSIAMWFFMWNFNYTSTIKLIASASMFTSLGVALTRIIILLREWYVATSTSVLCEDLSVASASFTSSKDNERRLTICSFYMLYIFSISLIWILWLIPTFSGQSIDITRLGYLVAFLLLVVTKFHERLHKDTIKLVSMAMNMNKVFVRFISHELRSHMGHLSMGLEQLADEVPVGADTTARMIEELKDSCDSSLQILNDVLVFDGLDAKEQKSDLISVVKVKRIISTGIKEIEPVVSELSLDLNMCYSR